MSHKRGITKSPRIAPRGLNILFGYDLFHILDCSLWCSKASECKRDCHVAYGSSQWQRIGLYETTAFVIMRNERDVIIKKRWDKSGKIATPVCALVRNDTGVMFRRESPSWLPLTRELLSISETEGEKHYVSSVAFLSLRLLLRKIHLPHQREARFISRSKSNRIPCQRHTLLLPSSLLPLTLKKSTPKGAF